ncbi:MAG: macro domain-containing protein [Clostridium sp.]|nr:macro domain-containing protein [Clostridium sp.]
MKILECSTAGDKRFSAMVAKVSVNGVIDTIENHYQKSKAFLDENGDLYTVNASKEAKGKKPVAFKISGYYLPLSYGAMFYDLLWYKYLKANPELELILEKYDDYSDRYKSRVAYNCQADSIRRYMKDKDGNNLSKEDRGKKIMEICKPLLNILKGFDTVVIEKGDIFTGYINIVGHQVNCQGVMGKGIASIVKSDYPRAYSEYISYSQINKDNLLGDAQIVKCGGKYICNLYAQEYYGNDKTKVYTSYEALRYSLTTLKEFAKSKGLIVGLPYGIGCGLANGDWNIVLSIIKDVFKDYYVILYKI